MCNQIAYISLLGSAYQFYLLPLRRDQPVDFRHLPVEVTHNLVLLVAEGGIDISNPLKSS